MTEEEMKKQYGAAAAADRLEALFTDCPGRDSAVHSWNMDSRKCQHCGTPYPYPRDEL